MINSAPPELPGVLRREVLPTWLQAHRTLEVMNQCLRDSFGQTLQRLRSESRAHQMELEALRQQTLEDLEKAKQEQARRCRQEAVAAWQNELLKAYGDSRRELARVKPQLLDLMLESLEHLLGQLDRQALHVRALQCLDESIDKNVSLHWLVHPDDLEVAQAALREWGACAEWVSGGLRISADVGVAVGNCKFRASSGDIEFGLATLGEALRAVTLSDQAAMSAHAP